MRFCAAEPVVIVSAVSTRVALEPGAVLSPWLAWKADVASLVLARARFVRLVAKGGSTTAAAFVSREDGVAKVLVLMMGANRLPGESGLNALAEALRPTR